MKRNLKTNKLLETVSNETYRLQQFGEQKVFYCDFFLAVILLCAINIICILHLTYTCIQNCPS